MAEWIPPSQEVAGEELLNMAVAWGMMTMLLASVNDEDTMAGMFGQCVAMSQHMIENVDGALSEFHTRLATGQWRKDINNPEHVAHMREQFGWKIGERGDDDEE